MEGPQRVYNLEVASLDGQITHNYFVGEDEVWTHNSKLARGVILACKLFLAGLGLDTGRLPEKKCGPAQETSLPGGKQGKKPKKRPKRPCDPFDPWTTGP